MDAVGAGREERGVQAAGQSTRTAQVPPLSLVGAAAAAAALTIALYAASPGWMTTRLLPVGAIVILLSACAYAVLYAAALRGAARLEIARRGVAVLSLVIALLGACVTGGVKFAWDQPWSGSTLLVLGVPCAMLAGLAVGTFALEWLLAKLEDRTRCEHAMALHVSAPAVVLSTAIGQDLLRFVHFAPKTRGYLLALVAISTALAFGSLLLTSRRRALRVLGSGGLLLIAAVLLWFDATQLRHNYEHLHLAAWLGTVFVGARVAGAALAGRPRGDPRRGLAVVALAISLVVIPLTSASLRHELLDRVGPGRRIARAAGLRVGTWTLPPAPVLGDVLERSSTLRMPRVTDVGEASSLVLICIDTVRYDRDLPGLLPLSRAFFERGARFTAARAPAPGTFETLNAVFSGTYPDNAGSRDAATGIPRDGALLWDRLRARGGRTSYCGFYFVHHRVGELLGPRFDDVDSLLLDAAAETCERAIERITELERDATPFGLFVHLGRAHEPYDSIRPASGDSIEERYDACVRDLDDALGPLYARLDRLAAERPLTVVLFSDHGEELGERGGAFHNSTTYEELSRVVLMVRAPGVPSQVRDEAVSLVDVGATLQELTCADVPAGLDGRSLVPLLRGEAWAARPAVIERHDHGELLIRAAVLGRWKLIANYVAGTLQVYDLEADPGERDNLVGELARTPPELRAVLGLPTGD